MCKVCLDEGVALSQFLYALWVSCRGRYTHVRLTHLGCVVLALVAFRPTSVDLVFRGEISGRVEPPDENRLQALRTVGSHLLL